jgi:hypothetical protein
MFRNVEVFTTMIRMHHAQPPKLEVHPLSAVDDCLVGVFAPTLHIWRPFILPQPEDAPCRGDREPRTVDGLIYAYVIANTVELLTLMVMGSEAKNTAGVALCNVSSSAVGGGGG